MSLGQFTELYALFYNRNNFKDSYANMLLPVKILRNAAAHNNCLINRLKPPYSRSINPSYKLRDELTQNVGLSKKQLEKKLVHPAIHDFATLLYLYSRIVPCPAREHAFANVKHLFEYRMLRHKDFYEKNEVLKSSYDFVRKIANYYCL